MTFLAQVASRVFNSPLLIHPDKAQVILWVLGSRIGIDAGTEPPNTDANRFLGEPRPDTGHRFRQAGDAALIPITGTLINRGAFIGTYSGEQSYEGINAQLTAALSDPHIKRVVLDIDSPGGEAGGMAGLAAAVRKANAIKPVTAVVNDLAASAAYGIASGAGRIVVSPTSTVGSIGVVLVHLDNSERLAKFGLNATLIHAGPRKADGNPFQPLTEDALENLRNRVEQIYSLFINEVVQGRPNLSAESVRGLQSNVFLGQQAIDLGLADEIGCCEDVITQGGSKASAVLMSHSPAAAKPENSEEPKEFRAGLAGRGNDENEGPDPAAGPDSAEDMEPMTKEDTGSAEQSLEPKEVTLDSIKADHPEIADALRDEGAQAEHDRIKAIDELAMAGHEELIASMKADRSVTPEQAATRVVHAEKQVKQNALQTIADADKKVDKIKPAPKATGEDEPQSEAKSGEEAWQAEWDKDEDLQAEFGGDFDRYKAFRAAEDAGRVRVLRKA